MITESKPVIDMQGVSKIFYTDEVETHALSEINLAIQAWRICLHYRAFRLR